MQFLPFVFFVVYIALAIFVLTLISRFVAAHERVADSMEKIAQSLHERDTK